jgi:hypothetical protein
MLIIRQLAHQALSREQSESESLLIAESFDSIPVKDEIGTVCAVVVVSAHDFFAAVTPVLSGGRIILWPQVPTFARVNCLVPIFH